MTRIIIPLILLLIGGMIFVYGYKNYKKDSINFNVLEFIGSIFIGGAEASNIGLVLMGALIVISSVLALILGWGK
jgi:hypothetical protein